MDCHYFLTYVQHLLNIEDFSWTELRDMPFVSSRVLPLDFLPILVALEIVGVIPM